MPINFGPWFDDQQARRAAALTPDSTSAITLPLAESRLQELATYGSGKDTDLCLTLADGTDIEMGLNSLTIKSDAPMTTDLLCVDDNNVLVRYSAPNLQVSALRVSYALGRETTEEAQEFAQAAQDWATGGFTGNFGYVVHAHITLTRAPD